MTSAKISNAGSTEEDRAEKPTVEQLLAESGCQDTMPLGVYLDLRAIMYRLKQERQRQQLSLADVSDRSGIDTAALSRLESGKMDNPTIETVFRIAKALGKRVVCDLEDLVPST